MNTNTYKREQKLFKELYSSIKNGNLTANKIRIKNMKRPKLFRLMSYWTEQTSDCQGTVNFFERIFND